MQIHNTKVLDNQHMKQLIFGGSGSGKTSFAGSAAARVKTIIGSAEAGLLPLQNLKDEAGNSISVDYVPIKSFADMERFFMFLRNEKHDYQCVVIDSLTEIQKACKDAIMLENKQEALEMRGWGLLATRIEKLVRAFRDLPMHLVVTALEETETDKLTGEVKVMPSLQGSVQKQLPAYFDIVLYAYTKEIGEGADKKTIHGVLTQNTGKFIAKDRTGKLPRVIENPSFAKIQDLVYGPQTTKEKV